MRASGVGRDSDRRQDLRFGGGPRIAVGSAAGGGVRDLPSAAHDLMGASLPAAARWVESHSKGLSWMGLLYGPNTAGAVLGCLMAGFYLLRVSDITGATFAAAAVNGAVALAGLALSKADQGGSRAGRPRRPALEGKLYGVTWPSRFRAHAPSARRWFGRGCSA